MVALQAILATMVLGTAEPQMELLNFSAPWCGPCQQMEPIVSQMQAQGYPIRKVNVDQEPALAQQWQVTGVPCFVMLVGGREVARSEGAVSRQRLEQMLATAQAQAAQAPPAEPQRGGLRLPSMPSMPSMLPEAPLASAASALAKGRDAVRDRLTGQSSSSSGEGREIDPAVGTATLVPAITPEQAQAARSVSNAYGDQLAPGDELSRRLIASTVRLRIEDAGGRSVGSGTIIDARQGEALVLTCAHVFRESQGKGKVYVDLFGAGAPQNLEGRVISYDLKSDVGLLSIRPGVPVQVAPLAATGYRITPGDTVVSVGCDHGAAASARHSRITSIDKYLLPPNLQVAGQPVQGRSGGGLFTREGLLIGVCNAADPADDEGLFSALPSVRAELERIGIATLVSTPAEAAIASTPPEMPSAMPGGVMTAGGMITPGTHGSNVVLATHDQALVEQLLQNADGAEVICIVRSLADPRAKSEVIVLDRVGPQFLEHLVEARRAQDARHLTSIREPHPPVQNYQR